MNYNDDQVTIAGLENQLCSFNTRIKPECLVFDNHQLHLEIHQEFLRVIDPKTESIFNKILYFFKILERPNTEELKNHIQDHINMLHYTNQIFQPLDK